MQMNNITDLFSKTGEILFQLIESNPMFRLALIMFISTSLFKLIFELFFRHNFNAANSADDFVNNIGSSNDDNFIDDECTTIDDDYIVDHSIIELRCKNCGAQLDFNDNSDILTCDYCNTKYKIK